MLSEEHFASSHRSQIRSRHHQNTKVNSEKKKNRRVKALRLEHTEPAPEPLPTVVFSSRRRRLPPGGEKKEDTQDAACARKVGLPCGFPTLLTSSASVRFQERSDVATGLPTKNPPAVSGGTNSRGWTDGELRACLSRSRSHQVWDRRTVLALQLSGALREYLFQIRWCLHFPFELIHLWQLHEDQRPRLVNHGPAMLVRQATPWG